MADERVVVVTGAGGGIGKEVARRFLAQGARVVGTDLGGRAAASSGELAGGDRYVPLDADITDEGDVAHVFAVAQERWGRLDVVVNVAAVTGHALNDDTDVVRTPLDVWDRIIEVNLRGTMLMCRAAIPALLASGGGAIVNVSSRAAVHSTAALVSYAASKAAVNSLTQSIAAAFGRQGIRANAIMPGLVLGTDAADHVGLTPETLAARTEQSLVGRLGRPGDIAAMALFLASPDDASYVNGQILSCDGGSGI